MNTYKSGEHGFDEHLGRAERNRISDEKLRLFLKQNDNSISSGSDLTPVFMEALDEPANGVINALNRAVYRDEITRTIGPVTDLVDPRTDILKVSKNEPA